MEQVCQEVDAQIVDDVRLTLFDDGCLDLAALNIQRGRDHGIPPYNDVREAMGLSRAQSFADVTSNGDLQQKLEAAYSSVDAVDAWVGGLAENVDSGAVGELFGEIIADQFR